MSLFEHPHCAENGAHDPCDGRLARPWVATEHHVQTQAGRWQVSLFPLFLHLEEIGERTNLLLDVAEPDQPIQFGE
jgi:hypothetical protein